MSAAVLLLTFLAFADPPKDVVDFFRSLAASLSDAHEDGNARVFLDHFDKSMPGYADFSDRIEALIGAGDVLATIEFVNQDGDANKRTLDLDWILQFDGDRPKRAVLKCTMEKVGKKWKVTSLSPLEFFRRD